MKKVVGQGRFHGGEKGTILRPTLKRKKKDIEFVSSQIMRRFREDNS